MSASFIATGRCICGCRKALTEAEFSLGDYRGICAVKLAAKTGNRAVLYQVADAYGISHPTARRVLRDVNEDQGNQATHALMVAGGFA